MLNDSLLSLSNGLVAGRYAVDVGQVLPDAGGGLTAYLARDRLGGDAKRVAIAVSRDASPRNRALKVLNEPIDNLMVPLGYGSIPLPGGHGEGLVIVCTSPPGSPVSAGLSPWPEKALIDLVLRPVARVLDILSEYKLTHRAIRLNNVFQFAPGQPVTLGAAWAAPPAMHQPAVFESPYNAMCHPAGRGNGSIADDVYALGVLLVSLAGGKLPLASLDDEAVIRWKLDLGSFTALTRDVPLSGFLADLLRGMLADEPEHRPQPAQLLDPGSARTRRLPARPSRRSQRPLMLNNVSVFDARTLAYALATDEKRAVQFLRNGLVTQWLRRGLGNATLAAEIEDLVRGRTSTAGSGPLNDPLLIMHTIAVLNPLMPLCWHGISLWPDGLPGILAQGVASGSDLMAIAGEIVTSDIAGVWSSNEFRQDRAGLAALPANVQVHRQFLQSGGSGGLMRLFYALNPMLPCRSPALVAGWVWTMPDLMRFLEKAAVKAGESLIDLHIAAFTAARADQKTELQVNALISAKDPTALRMGELGLLADLQARYFPGPLPALAKWVATRLRPDLDRWHNRPRREAMRVKLDALAEAGILTRLLALTEDQSARSLDVAGVKQAFAELAAIDAEIASIQTEDTKRLVIAQRSGQAIAGGIGLSALILMLMSVVLR